MGIADNFKAAFYKSQISTGVQFPKSGTVFLSIRNEDKTKIMGEACKIISKVGFKIVATKGTKSFLDKEGVDSIPVKKVFEEIDTETFNMSTAFKNNEEWDSMVALSLITLLDEEFNVSITGEKIKELNTIEDLAKYVNKENTNSRS